MIVLDENVLENQREIVHRRRIRARQIGVDVAPKGLDDEAILSLLVKGSRELATPWRTAYTRPGGG